MTSNSESYKLKLSQFKDNAHTLFDICTCKCRPNNECTCKKERRVPDNEVEFLYDQRDARKMFIGCIDQVETKRLLNRQMRREGLKRQITPEKDSVNMASTRSDDMAGGENRDEKIEHDVPCSQPKENNTKQMRINLPALVMACDRHRLSDRSAAAISTAVLHDMGLVKNDDMSKIIDKNKIRREREKMRTELQQEPNNNVPGLYFDGRKDKTIVQLKETDGKFHRRTVVEEHVSIISEPGSSYFCHIAPSGGSSNAITQAILSSLDKYDVKKVEIKVIGCDGTAVNTGTRSGVIRLMEENLQAPVHWFVCQLHANELPLRHLFAHLDGPTTGPCGFSGPIGKSLHSCDELHVCDFARLEGYLPPIESSDLSTDQQYMYDICSAVISGVCPPDLGLRKPGLINHSRWLTTGNRIMRLYVASPDPSEELQILANFIVQVYATMWFTIKMKPSCKDGAKHLFETILRSRYLSDDLRGVIDPIIQRNGYFGHPENILLSMIADDRPAIRELGLRRILKARNRQHTLRVFKLPTLNFNATDYIGLIDWQDQTVITEPPLTMNKTDEELLRYIREEETPYLVYERFPCHTQAVKRCVKLVTEASAVVCAEARRDGFIRARLQSRANMPHFNTKSDYRL